MLQADLVFCLSFELERAFVRGFGFRLIDILRVVGFVH